MDEDFPSLQEAAMLARGVKVEEQRKHKAVSKATGKMSCITTKPVCGFPTRSDTNQAVITEDG